MDHDFSGRGMKIIGITLLIYVLLVATHEGEFWPFSIYPMFSQAGNPWTRAMVLDVSDMPEDRIWEIRTLQNLESEPVPVGSLGVDQIDYSNFISKTQNWTEPRKKALKEMFGSDNIGQKAWMASKVRGELIGEDSVSVKITPYLLIRGDSVLTNPNLPDSDYFRGGSR
jgi:hypothetical protein